MIDREKLKPIYKEYKNNGGIISPMNTESCRRYLQEKSGRIVEPEDVLWLFYHTWQNLKFSGIAERKPYENTRSTWDRK